MKKIKAADVEKFARSNKISNALAAKRLLNYGKANNRNACQECDNMVVASVAGKRGMCCHVIGIQADEDSWVANGYGCDAFKRGVPVKW